LNSNGSRKEKRARRVVTRPEPTIYGNCDSWSFIVGKKPRAYRPRGRREGSLQTCNRILIHRLFTKTGGRCRDKLWAICGLPVEQPESSRMVGWAAMHMPLIQTPGPLFYRKTCIAAVYVSKCTLYDVQKCTENICRPIEKKPQTRLRVGAFGPLSPDCASRGPAGSAGSSQARRAVAARGQPCSCPPWQ
jgi:hypothetical protein